MRDVVMFIILLGGIPSYFLNPFHGILAFLLVSIMNPNRYAYGPAYSFPFPFYIAIATLLGFLFGRGERYPFPREREVFLLGGLWLCFLVSAIFSLDPNMSWDSFAMVSKILFMTYITMFMCCSKQRITLLMWVIAISLGAIGLKGGLFGILTGGGLKVWGPPQTFIADNNDLGLAFNMALPIMYCLIQIKKYSKYRSFMLLVFFATILADILTFSRTAAVSLVVVAILMTLLGKNKIRNVLIILCISFLCSFYLSDAWKDRMNTIDDAKNDLSFLGRVNAWHSLWNIAVEHPLTGGGIGVSNSRSVFVQFAPEPNNFHSAHNSYFQILGETGFVGLFLYLLIYLGTLLKLNRLRKKYIDSSHQWISDYSSALLISIIAFLFNTLTIGRAYFDLAFLILSMAIMLISIEKRLEDDELSPVSLPSLMESACAE